MASSETIWVRTPEEGGNTHTHTEVSTHLKTVLWFPAVFLFLLIVDLPITGLSFKGCRLSWGKVAQQQKQPVRTKHTHVRSPVLAIVLSSPLRRFMQDLQHTYISSAGRGYGQYREVRKLRVSPTCYSCNCVSSPGRLTAGPMSFFCWHNGLFGKIRIILCRGNHRDVWPKKILQ